MIDRLILSRFRGVKRGVLQDLGTINFLVGPNNSGKTAILEALYWLSMSGRPCRLYGEDLPQEGLVAYIPIKTDLLGFAPCPRIWTRHGKPASWAEPPGTVLDDGTLAYRIPHLDKKQDPLKEFRLIPPPSEEIIDQERFELEVPKTISLFVLENPKGIDDVLKHYLPDIYPDTFSFTEELGEHFAFTWFPDFIYEAKSLGTWGVEGQPAAPECALFFDFHTTGGHFTPAFYWTIRNVPDWRDQLRRAFDSVFHLGNFTVNIEPHLTWKEKMQGVIEPKGKRPIPIDDFGDGARHAFKVLAALIALVDKCQEGREGIFLWEDPELFMHPKSLWQLLDQVMHLIQNKPIQLFISTQSLEVIASFVRIAKEKPPLQDISRLFRLDLREGELITARSTYPKLEGWLESGLDPRFWNQRDALFEYQIDENELENIE